MMKDNYLKPDKLIRDKKILRLFKAAEEHGGVLRFVGGAVRDALKGIDVHDLDLATDLTPDELVEACCERGLRTIPIGIKYGTVGVVIGDDVVEVTSLRKDIKTDGRHAIVEFTDNWEIDASRRDLTINAVYADEKGNVFDYYNGIDDLENGIVRFIGNPDIRIQEDFLRIMRFFRFYSIFGKGEIDKKALKACIKNRDGLSQISMDRICEEFKKLLLTPNVIQTLQIMFDNDILIKILPDSPHLDKLKHLIDITDNMYVPNKVLRRLFMLYLPDVKLAANLATRLRLTKKQKELFVLLAEVNPKFEEFLDACSLKKIIYLYGKDFARDKFLLFLSEQKNNKIDFNKKIAEIENMVVPIFQIRGKDIIAAGVSNNQKIGKVLDELEKAWIDSGFEMNRDELIAMIGKDVN